MLVKAAWAAAAVVSPADPEPPVIVPPPLNPILASVVVVTMLLPPVPATFAVKVTVEAPEIAVASALATVPVPYATPAPGPPLTAAARLAKVADVLAPIRTSFAAPVREATKV